MVLKIVLRYKEYYVATIIVLVAFGIKLLTPQAILGEIPFLIFFSSVVICGLYAGFRVGVYATLLSAGLAFYYFLPPTFTFFKDNWHQDFKISLYILDCITMAALCGKLKEKTSDAKKSSEDLKSSEAKFKTIADAMPQMVWSTLPNGLHDYYNQQWYDFTGVPAGSTDGAGWNDVFHPDDQERAWKLWSHSLRTGEDYQIEYRLRHHSGEYRWTLGRALPIRNDSGEIIRWMGTCTDIHDIKKTEKDLADAVIARDEFLSIASHELKTPLTSLRLQNQILQRRMQKTVESHVEKDVVMELSKQNDKQVSRLTRLVDDMLDIARIRTGILTVKKEEFDIRVLVSEVLNGMGEQLTSVGCDYKDVTPLENSSVFLDRLRVEQVVTNLLTNALRYGQSKPIEVDLKISNDHVTFSVTDHGIGIAKENIDIIFERFERAVHQSEVSGLGLGLFITKQIVSAHQGRIWVESEPGKGSTFYVELPKRLS